MTNSATLPQLTLEVERKNGAAIVHCHGRLVAGVGDILHSTIGELLPHTKRIVLDLTDLAYADSMGLGSLVRVYVSARTAGCELELVNLGKRLRELLGVTHLMAVFTIIGEHSIHMKF